MFGVLVWLSPYTLRIINLPLSLEEWESLYWPQFVFSPICSLLFAMNKQWSVRENSVSNQI